MMLPRTFFLKGKDLDGKDVPTEIITLEGPGPIELPNKYSEVELPESLQADEYQDLTHVTSSYPKIEIMINGSAPIEVPWLYPLLGLVGETGEVADKFKKLIRDQKGEITPEFQESIELELGDASFYLARIVFSLKRTLSYIFKKNVNKLFSRKSRGKIGGSGDNR